MIDTMHEYQRRHNVSNMCISNVTTLLDLIDGTREKFRAKTVFAVWEGAPTLCTRDNGSTFNNTPITVCAHLVVEYNGIEQKLLDPSFETAQHKPTYVDSFSKLPSVMAESNDRLKTNGETYQNGDYSKEVFMAVTLRNFLDLASITRKLNHGGWAYAEGGKEFYHAQFDFLTEHREMLPLEKKRKVYAAIRSAARP